MSPPPRRASVTVRYRAGSSGTTTIALALVGAALSPAAEALVRIGGQQPTPQVVPWPAQCDRFASGKCGPALVIAGVKKCGTNTLDGVLRSHPYASFKGQSQAGKRWIQSNGGGFTGENWYLECGLADYVKWAIEGYGCQGGKEPDPAAYSRMFDDTDWNTSFAVDRSPLALFGARAATRLKQLAPNARVVVVVCDPVKRAWSSINHENKRWVHRKPERSGEIDRRLAAIPAAVDRLIAKYGAGHEGMRRCIKDARKAPPPFFHDDQLCREVLLPGLFFDGIQQFAEQFRPEQVIVIDGEWFMSNQTSGAHALFNALGAPVSPGWLQATEVFRNRGKAVNAVYKETREMPEQLELALKALYKPTMASLAHMFDSHVITNGK